MLSPDEEEKLLKAFLQLSFITTDIFKKESLSPSSPSVPNIILVGGLAITFWYVELIAKRNAIADFFEFNKVFSNDVDLYGNKKSVAICESALNVEFARPLLFSPSPNVARVILESDYVEGGIIVDVLRGLHGIEDKEIIKHYTMMTVNDTVIAIITPLLCLKSRICNLYAPFCSDRQREVERAFICIRLTSIHLQDKLAKNGFKECRKDVEEIIGLAQSKEGLRAHKDFKLNVLDVFEGVRGLPADFLNIRLPAVKAHIKKKLHRTFEYNAQP